MAKKTKPRRKLLDNIILALVVGCMLLIVVHQTINVIDYTIPEPTPTRYVGGSNQYIGDGVEDEDILPTFTPSPIPTP